MANMLTRALSWPALVFFFCTWAVYLAGIACLQHNCIDGTTGAGEVPYPASASNTYGLASTWGWSSIMPCTRFFRFYWFIVAFAFVTVVGALIATGPKYGLSSSRPFWIGMFSINALLFMIASEAALAARDSSLFTGGEGLTCMRTAAAGAIMSVVACVFLLMTIGTDWETGHSARDDRKPASTYATRRQEEGGLPVANPAGPGTVTYAGTA